MPELDLIPLYATFIASLIIGLDYGMIIGIGVNVLFIFYEAARPKLSIETTTVSDKLALLSMILMRLTCFCFWIGGQQRSGSGDSRPQHHLSLCWVRQRCDQHAIRKEPAIRINICDWWAQNSQSWLDCSKSTSNYYSIICNVLIIFTLINEGIEVSSGRFEDKKALCSLLELAPFYYEQLCGVWWQRRRSLQVWKFPRTTFDVWYLLSQ